MGLFIIYPVFLGCAQHLRGATPERIGLALGAYGLAQGVSQIPFGLLSDQLGRKLAIGGGLGLFAFGSVVAAMAMTIEGVLLGRILQGTGAVGSAALALVADLTHEEVRTRAMAIVLMVPIVILAERGARMKEVFLLTILTLAASLPAFAAAAAPRSSSSRSSSSSAASMRWRRCCRRS